MLLLEAGIVHKITPEHNSVAERYYCMIVERVRPCGLALAPCPLPLALNGFIQLLNGPSSGLLPNGNQFSLHKCPNLTGILVLGIGCTSSAGMAMKHVSQMEPATWVHTFQMSQFRAS